MTECNTCLGYGFWAWGHIAPMGSLDAKDGVPTIKCPECGANPNPIESEGMSERYKQLEELYKAGKLNFGVYSNTEDYTEAWKEANK